MVTGEVYNLGAMLRQKRVPGATQLSLRNFNIKNPHLCDPKLLHKISNRTPLMYPKNFLSYLVDRHAKLDFRTVHTSILYQHKGKYRAHKYKNIILPTTTHINLSFLCQYAVLSLLLNQDLRFVQMNPPQQDVMKADLKIRKH